MVMGDKVPNLLWVVEEPRFLQILCGRVDAISPIFVLFHIMYSTMSFRKPTPPHNRQFNILIGNIVKNFR